MPGARTAGAAAAVGAGAGMVASRYGSGAPETSGEPEEDVDARGGSTLAIQYELAPSAPDQWEKEVKIALSRMRGSRGILNTLLSGPNLLLPLGRARERLSPSAREDSDALRLAVQDLSWRDGAWQWGARAKVLDALTRALLRKDILLRLLARPNASVAGSTTGAQRTASGQSRLTSTSPREASPRSTPALQPSANTAVMSARRRR